MDIYSNLIGTRGYDSLITPYGPVSYDTFTSQKMEQTHNQLFNKAITAYALANGIDLKEYKIVDNKREVFFEPSEAIFIHKIKSKNIKANTIKKIDFSEYPYVDYWDNSYVINTIFLNPAIKVIKNDSDELDYSFEDVTNACIYDSEIIEWDFARGRAKLRSKTKDVVFSVDYKYLTNYIPKANELSLEDTFSYKYKHL